MRHYPLLLDSPALKIWVATVQPGYDDTLMRDPGYVLGREDGALYRSTFDAALGSDPQWVFITSWNEWWEHTHIEPSVNFGHQYLQITGGYAGRWEGHYVYLPFITVGRDGIPPYHPTSGCAQACR